MSTTSRIRIGKSLYDLIDTPVDSTVLVLTCETLDRRKKSFKKLSEAGVWVDLKRPYENQIPDWIDYLGFQKGLKIHREAAVLIKQFVGVNLTEINNEVEKLKNYAGGRSEIGVNDVLAIVCARAWTAFSTSPMPSVAMTKRQHSYLWRIYSTRAKRGRRIGNDHSSYSDFEAPERSQPRRPHRPKTLCSRWHSAISPASVRATSKELDRRQACDHGRDLARNGSSA